MQKLRNERALTPPLSTSLQPRQDRRGLHVVAALEIRHPLHVNHKRARQVLDGLLVAKW